MKQEKQLDLSVFPTTRYQGSKRKLLPWLATIFDDLDFDSAIDLMGGSASVSFLLKKMGKQVTVNDYLKFNYHCGLALIENSTQKLDKHDLSWMMQKHPRIEYADTVEKEFSRMYYTRKENQWIDVFMSHLLRFEGAAPDNIYPAAIARYALYQACLMKRPFNLFHRKNLYLRSAKVTRTFGNKTTWEQPFEKLVSRLVAEVNAKIFDNGRANIALNLDALSPSNTDFDLAYIDPPYFYINGSQRKTDYRRVYHFLEGLADYENWRERIDRDCSLKSLQETNESLEELYKSKKPELRRNLTGWFDSLFDVWRNSTIVLSYKRPGLPSPDTLKRMLERHGKKVRMCSRPYTYALHAMNGRKNHNIEIILIAE